ncbi:MAG: hypothetical protein ACKV1O_10080 [Saprospiraceae bacterium]
MTASSASNRKGYLISAIQAIQDEQELAAVEQYLKVLHAKRQYGDIIQPMRASISIEAMKIEQAYKGFNGETFDTLAADLDIQEPVEELLAMLD